MIYLYIDKNQIKLLALSKTLLGQYNVSFFQKKHEQDLLDDNKVKNIDVLASAIKEAFTLAVPKEVTDKQVFLILPESCFDFRGYDVPPDISETAILPFIRDKSRADIPYDLEEGIYDYLVTKHQNESKVLFYSQKHDIFQGFIDATRLLNLSIVSVFPETLAYYKLFEKTLKRDKKENILYVFYEKGESFGFIYNSLGLIVPDRLEFDDDVEASLKHAIEKLAKDNLKIDRVILSGEESKKVRQDHFTKNVGAWTNPLDKIISTFYREYLKLIIVPQEKSMSLLDLDVAIGAFIYDRENGLFAPPGRQKTADKKPSRVNPGIIPKVDLSFLKRKKEKSKGPAESSGESRFKFLSRRDLAIFLISFGLSFSIIYFFPKGLFQNSGSGKKINIPFIAKAPTQTPTPAAPTATPTPSFKKETLKISILNGTGIPGKAAQVKNILREKGYSEILTGNASNFGFALTEIQVKDEKKQAAEAVKKDLGDDVKISTISKLDATSAADLIIIVGTDFK